MVQIDALLFILLLEVGAVAVIALAVLGVLALRRRSRAERTARAVLAGESGAGVDPLGPWLQRRGGPGDQAAEAALAEIRSARGKVLHQALRGSLRGDAAVLPAVRDELDGLIAQLSRLAPAGAAASAAVDAEAGNVSTDELEELRGQNQQLTEELRITQQTMDKMLNEYAAIYDGESGGRDGETAYPEDALELTTDPEETAQGHGGQDPGGPSADRDPADELLMLPEDFREEEPASR